LENRRGTDNEMSRGMWKEMEDWKTNKARMAEAKSKREKRRF